MYSQRWARGRRRRRRRSISGRMGRKKRYILNGCTPR
jgi:hypothetical protein